MRRVLPWLILSATILIGSTFEWDVPPGGTLSSPAATDKLQILRPSPRQLYIATVSDVLGVLTASDLGLGTSDIPEFAGLTLSGLLQNTAVGTHFMWFANASDPNIATIATDLGVETTDLAGVSYYNTSLSVWRTYSGTAWVNWLTTLTETDPIAGAIDGLVESDGAGNLTAAAASDVVALWESGSCVGFLKNDGTCADPTGSYSTTTTLVAIDSTLNSATFSAGTKPLLVTAASVQTLPTAAANLVRQIGLEMASGTVTLRPASSSDVIKYNGTAITAGYDLDCTAKGLLTVMGTAVNAWSVFGLASACAEGSNSFSDVTAPTVTAATISADGVTVTVTFDETVVTTGYDNGDFDMDCATAGAGIALNTISGSGATRTFTAASTVNVGDTCNLDYTGGADEIEDAAGNDLAGFTDAAVTNSSTQGGGPVETLWLSQTGSTAAIYGWSSETRGQKITNATSREISKIVFKLDCVDTTTDCNFYVSVWSDIARAGTQYGTWSDVVTVPKITPTSAERTFVFTGGTNPTITGDVFIHLVDCSDVPSGGSCTYTSHTSAARITVNSDVNSYETTSYDFFRAGADVNYDAYFKVYDLE